MTALKRLWQWLRAVMGDDAYDRYIAHHAHAHAGDPPLSRRAFFVAEEERKWKGINRCC